ncbi:Nif3-like dinuclear metal center hexameric protein [Desulfococcus sp.]|uniref:Nif3-like dinuclear metal center hexameric protein n=1 Tax=Desulfococcus sp. TaxID=2025834 RepID=UPI0035938BB0
MTVTVADLIGIMDQIAPPALSEEWDNVGLQVGRKDWPVKKIWVSLDPTPAVVAAACETGVDLLITHHPLWLKPPKTIDFETPPGKIVHQSALHQLSIFSAHTNLDSVTDGINDVLAARMQLTGLVPLAASSRAAGEGIGRVGTLTRPTTLASLVQAIRETSGATALRYSGDPDMAVRRVAVCSGSGSSLMGAFFASGADVYISGDLRYHDARDAEAAGRGLIDMGHFASEHIIVGILAERLRVILKKMSLPVLVAECPLEKDPFVSI